LIKVALATLYFFVSVLFFPYGYNALFLVIASKLYRLPKVKSIQDAPKVTVQLPIYNERYVVKRLLEAVFSLDWPGDRLQVLVLDDSTDDTSSIIDSEIQKHRSKGIEYRVVRRDERIDFKAGALQNALNYTDGKYVAIFDADFIPPGNFLKETIPWLEKDPELAIVQTRWGHINRDYNSFTEAFALGMDGHYLIEQTGRYSLGLLFNFNGTCGVIRVEAIRDAGGWSAETME
jgi:cellulose synthase/poly-beta-1,6-N-acetylglucosamine synthase-like glycosyltransferase